jgi:hypothetical protein
VHDFFTFEKISLRLLIFLSPFDGSKQETEEQREGLLNCFYVLFCKGREAMHFTLAKKWAFVYAPNEKDENFYPKEKRLSS